MLRSKAANEYAELDFQTYKKWQVVEKENANAEFAQFL